MFSLELSVRGRAAQGVARFGEKEGSSRACDLTGRSDGGGKDGSVYGVSVGCVCMCVSGMCGVSVYGLCEG